MRQLAKYDRNGGVLILLLLADWYQDGRHVSYMLHRIQGKNKQDKEKSGIIKSANILYIRPGAPVPLSCSFERSVVLSIDPVRRGCRVNQKGETVLGTASNRQRAFAKKLGAASNDIYLYSAEIKYAYIATRRAQNQIMSVAAAALAANNS